jgi:HK97 family phage prohead protease
MNRAYSILDIKALSDVGGRRVFSGIATTPSTDRMGDIVEPKGAEFVLPIPLLWQHNSREPIGWVTRAKVSDSGIEVECEMAKVEDVGSLQSRLDEAWHSLKAKLVRGLSIGFSALESTRIENTYAYRYVKWQWLELSAVTIPANADCSITTIKSADRAIQRAASSAGRIVRLDPTLVKASTVPGDTGHKKTRRPGVVYLK